MVQSERMENHDFSTGQKSLRIYVMTACGVRLEDVLFFIFLVGQQSCGCFMWVYDKSNQSALNLQTIVESE